MHDPAPDRSCHVQARGLACGYSHRVIALDTGGFCIDNRIIIALIYSNMKKLSGLFSLLNILILLIIPVIITILFGFTLYLIFGELSPRVFMMVIINTIFLGGGTILTYIIAGQLLVRLNAFLILLISFLFISGISITGFIFILINDPFLFIVEGMKSITYLVINFLFILALSTALTGNLVYQKQLNEKEKSILAEKILRMEMEKKILVSQINPHFLFNSLNLGVSLLDKPEMAESVLIKLSALLRYSLDAVNRDLIPMEEELEQVRNYLSIQKLRFDKRLHYRINGKASFPVPPFILQPLVENSIKYHIDKKGSLGIFINIYRDSANRIEIYDSYREIESSMLDKGTGMLNVKKRVELAGGSFTIQKGSIHIAFTA